MAAVSLLQGACTLREEDLLCDYTIEVEDQQFKVHKVIMASVSDYFKVMLTAGMKESQSDRVKLHELCPLAVSNMIEFIYTGEFGEPTASPEELLSCAVYLQIPAAIEESTKRLMNKVDPQNCFNIIDIFKTYSIQQGVEKITQYIKSNIKDIKMEVCPPEMPFYGFQCFVEFWQKSEWELFLCVLEWVDEDKNRAQHLDELLSRVRFALMTARELSYVKEMDVYIEPQGAWQDLVTAAEAFHNLPTHLKVLDESEQSRVRIDPVPICYKRDDKSLYSLHDGKSWKKHKAELEPTLYNGMTAHIVVNNYLISYASHYSRKERTVIHRWHVFDPRTSTWSTIAPMNVDRDDFAVVHYKSYLYALGGRTESRSQVTDAIERYDFETDSWEVIPSKLPGLRRGHGACVISDRIYVAGGYQDALSYIDNALKTHDCLDMNTNTWQTRAPMSIDISRRSSLDIFKMQVMKLWGEEVLFTFEHTFVMHYYSPTTDLWSQLDCLSQMDSDFVHYFCPYVVADQNTLYLHSFACSVKGNSTDDSYSHHGFHKNLISPGFGEGNGCVKWTVGHEGEKISEVKLDDLPVNECGWGCKVFKGLLSLPSQH